MAPPPPPIRCEECGHSIPKHNIALHRAQCRQQKRREASAVASTSTSGSYGANGTEFSVNLFVAYVLWALFGFMGVHHAYLGRPFQALGWYATSGLFGWGLIRDVWRMPYYAALARDDRVAEVTAKVRAATVAARGGVPEISLLRIITMGIFGVYFGIVASSLVVLPEGAGWANTVYKILYTFGVAGGIWLVGNMGEETIQRSEYGVCDTRGTAVRLVAACLAGSAFFDRPILVGVIYATRCRKYTPSISPTTTASKRITRHILACSAFTVLLALATYNHGGIVVNDRKIFVHEAIRNALNSDFWKEFDFDEFQSQFRESSGRGGSEYLKRTFDLEGERAARRTLGVQPDAPWAEVRAAYKKLALRWHPDKIGSDTPNQELEEAKRRFVRLQEAYDILNELEQRKKKKEGFKRQGDAGGGFDMRGSSRGDEM